MWATFSGQLSPDNFGVPEALIECVKFYKKDANVHEYSCEQCKKYNRGIFDHRCYDSDVLEAFVVWAKEFLKQRAQHGRVGESQAARIKRKWCARITQVQKVLYDGSNVLAASIWQDLCGDDLTEPDECDAVVLSTFLKQYEEEVKRLQGTVSR